VTKYLLKLASAEVDKQASDEVSVQAASEKVLFKQASAEVDKQASDEVCKHTMQAAPCEKVLLKLASKHQF
jgi:predicted ATPase